MQPIRFTKDGYEKLQKDYAELLRQRPAAVDDLRKAREMGDLSENGYYKASKSKLIFIDGQIRQTKIALKFAVVVDTVASEGIGIGSKVCLANGEKELQFAIVGDLEANPSEGKISLLSPLGKALAGKKVSEEVIITTPSKSITYKILKIIK